MECISFHSITYHYFFTLRFGGMGTWLCTEVKYPNNGMKHVVRSVPFRFFSFCSVRFKISKHMDGAEQSGMQRSGEE